MLKIFKSMLNNQLLLYRRISLGLAFLSAVLLAYTVFLLRTQGNQEILAPAENEITSTKQIPHYQQIKDLIEPLQYSGLPALLRPNVSLHIDFAGYKWKLKNIHQFDKQGQILLDNDRFGLCGELAAFVFPRVTKLLGPEYHVEFVQVAESGFFLQPQSSHIALIIQDLATSNLFFLDPSFHRYGILEDFDNYLFYAHRQQLDFIANQTLDVIFEVNAGTPVLIRNERIVFLTVEEVAGKFNEDNFAIALTANRRYHYAGRYIFLAKKQNGNVEILENRSLAEKIFSLNDYAELTRRILSWIDLQS